MTGLEDWATALPPEFDENVYGELHADLKSFTGAELKSHYDRHDEFWAILKLDS